METLRRAPNHSPNETKKIELVALFMEKLFTQSQHEILMVWGNYLPSGCVGVVSALERIFDAILFSPIEFSIEPHYVQLFPSMETLRIPLHVIRHDAKRCLEIMQCYADDFFRIRATRDPMEGFPILRDFQYNSILEEHMQRSDCIVHMVYKTLMVSLQHENGCYYLSCLESLRGALRTLLVNRKGQNRDAISVILKILETLRRDDLSTYLKEQLHTDPKTSAVTLHEHGVRFWYETCWEHNRGRIASSQAHTS